VDSGANHMNPKLNYNPSLRATHYLILLVGVMGMLTGVRVVYSVPKPLLAVAAAMFVSCSIVFWLARRWISGAVLAQMLRLVLAWVAVSALLFGTAFWVDRAGWIWFRMTGYNVTLSEDHSNRVAMGVDAFLHYNAMFEPATDNSGGIVLRGEHVVDRTIVIPRGTHLRIEPGTVLRFGRGCSMISYGTITARGTEEQPIRFTARHPLLKWGVVGVVGGADGIRSVFEHTRFEHGRQARVNGIDFHGGLSLIGSDVEIRQSGFSDLFGKDAVYVRGGDVSIHDNVFRNTFKDGLDLDGGSGAIHHNRFVDCGDEGIDLSDNENVLVYDNVILDERGGRVSADHGLDLIRARNTLDYSSTHASAAADGAAMGVVR